MKEKDLRPSLIVLLSAAALCSAGIWWLSGRAEVDPRAHKEVRTRVWKGEGTFVESSHLGMRHLLGSDLPEELRPSPEELDTH